MCLVNQNCLCLKYKFDHENRLQVTFHPIRLIMLDQVQTQFRWWLKKFNPVRFIGAIYPTHAGRIRFVQPKQLPVNV